jgi:hypothetical protein
MEETMRLSTIMVSKPEGFKLRKQIELAALRREVLERDTAAMYPLRSDIEHKRKECLRILLLDVYADK